MNIDIHKIEQGLGLIYPYTKVIILAIYGAILLYINKIFIKDPILRKWLMASFQETPNSGASGKSLTGFLFAQLISFATIVAIMYSDKHILPDSMYQSLLVLIGSIYGIKVASKYFNGDDNGGKGSDIEENSTQTKTTTQTNIEVKKNETVVNDNTENSGIINTTVEEEVKKEDKSSIDENDKG